MLRIKRDWSPRIAASALTAVVAVLLLTAASACRRSAVRAERRPVALRIGLGLAGGAERAALQAARLLALDPLVSVRRDGRLFPRLAESWSVSEDGLVLHLRLRPQITFHDGKPANAGVIRQILQMQLAQGVGAAFEDVSDIRAVSDRDIEFSLRRRSTFVLERFDTPIQEPGSAAVGTGPFSVTSQDGNQIEMRANERYFAAIPSIDRITIKPYASVRAAWADLLRGQVDMLYDVGVEALESLESSNEVKVFTFQRGYAYIMLLNLRRPYLRDAAFRRQLNAAIDRDELVRDALRGHGSPADGVVWPYHWAYASDFPRFSYQPRSVRGVAPRRLTCVFNEPAYERLALVIQRQLQAIGVELELKLISGNELNARLITGDFDLFLSDFAHGPSMVRPYMIWHSGAPYNYGGFSSQRVDAALDSIRQAADDAAYRAGVAAFQRAAIEDPPAIFLAWRERARAVSTRFDVPSEPNTDILTAMHLWRLATEAQTARKN